MSETRTQPSVDAIAVLTAIADRLTTARPHAAMDEGRRLALVFRYANERHGLCTDAADELEREVLKHAPRLDRDVTRGEYALILRKIAGGAA
ncbi:hypothetical protein [Streptomyces sp. SYSU K21746]